MSALVTIYSNQKTDGAAPQRVTADAAALPERATPEKLVVSGTEHIVLHQSGTQNMLGGEDNMVITADMVAKADNSDLSEMSRDTGERPSNFCTPFNLRVLNSTDSFVKLNVFIDETDDSSVIGVGPGERYQRVITEPAVYVVSDDRGRFYDKYPVENCK